MADSPLYRIPDLEWKQFDSLTYKSETPIGVYLAYGWPSGEWRCEARSASWSWSACCNSLDDAKEQCNAHYRSRMARGLVEVKCES